MYDKCAICEQSTFIYTDSIGRKINSLQNKDMRITVCRDCILKFAIGFVAASLSGNREAVGQANQTRTQFKAAMLPPGT